MNQYSVVDRRAEEVLPLLEQKKSVSSLAARLPAVYWQNQGQRRQVKDIWTIRQNSCITFAKVWPAWSRMTAVWHRQPFVTRLCTLPLLLSFQEPAPEHNCCITLLLLHQPRSPLPRFRPYGSRAQPTVIRSIAEGQSACFQM